MVYNELEQEDTLSCVRVRLATIAYLDILLCSIWAIHKIRQSPIPKITWTGGTATWIARPVTVVCRDASSLVKCLRKYNSPGMIGIERLHAGVAEPVVPWSRRVQAPPMRVSGRRAPPI